MNAKNISNGEKIQQINSNNKIENIHNHYLWDQIFDYIPVTRKLKIVNYNKNLQKKLNVNIDIYKEYSTKYSSIEIEVKLVDNKHGKFINTTDNEFYHIYFDNSKEEVKRNYLD